MQNRDYDVVLYGASGFTGKQTVEYFARNLKPGQLRWAIAGRNRQKLEAVKAEIGNSVKDIDVLVADSSDQAAVDAMVSRTRVMLTTAGPYALYGTSIVDACVRFQTHYVDITGETPWVKDLITRYHDQAAADGTRIIPFCGFDSVPSDLGAYLMARYIQNQLGAQCTEVKAYFQVNGGLNGGTMATVFNLIEAGQAERARDVFLLNPPSAHSEQEIARNQDPKVPVYDPDIAAWAGPFFMSQINTRVVRRSAALYEQWQAPYGPNFFYQEGMKFGGLLGGFISAWLVLQTTFWGTDAEKNATVKLWGFCGPIGAWVTIWGCLAMLISAPFDNWWHDAYGLDVKILSPPHTVLALGMWAVVMGALLLVL